MKIHLRANKEKAGMLNYSRCAALSLGNGKVVKNSRETYKNIPQANIVGLQDFATIPAADRCAHCMDMGLQWRNALRKKRGQPRISNLFEDLK